MSWIIDSLDDKFLAHLDKLAEVQEAAADATCDSTNQRKWYMPPLDGWSGDPTDILGMKQAFDRAALNQAYIDVVSDPDRKGRIGESMLQKLQLDYISALERSFRTRHSSSIRAKVHAAARRSGHSTDGGLFDTGSGNLVTWLERLLEAAHDDPAGEP